RPRLREEPNMRAQWGLVVLPAALAGLAGADGLQRRVVTGVLEQPAGRDPWWRVAVRGLLAAPLGLMLWFAALAATANTIRCVLLYPLTDGPDYSGAWGGPSWQGAWAVHAGLAIVLFPIELWLLSVLSLLSAKVFAGDRARWVRPVAVVVAAAIVVFFY